MAQDYISSAAELIAVTGGSLFLGGSIFASAVDVPAMQQLPNKELPGYFTKFYDQATCLQGGAALLSGSASLLATGLGSSPSFALGACCMLSMVPYTIFIMGPTIKRMKELKDSGDQEKNEAKGLLTKWNRFHLARILGSAAAVVLFYHGLGLLDFSVEQ